tara:strand:- start:816 stop:1556 length:741 start_codon:yes stop_codon:yes gene_type:complete
MITFKEHMSVITLPLSSFIDPYEINKLYVKKYIFNDFTRTEKEFNCELIIELFNKREWFPQSLRDFNIQQQRTIEKNVYILYKCLALYWCELWKTNRIKGEKMIKTIERISNISDIPDKNYLINIVNIVDEKLAIKKIHRKFCKKNNVKLKEKIIKTLDVESKKQNKLNKEIDMLIKALKKKEDKLNKSLLKLNDANSIKSALIFPSVCKEIYNIYLGSPYKTEDIFKYPNDVTINIINILLAKKK